MTGIQIKTAAEAYLDDNLTANDVLIAINEAVALIGAKAMNFETIASSEYLAQQWYPLPANLLYVDEVNVDSGKNSIYLDYRLKGNQILFGASGNYIIHYCRQPNTLATINNTPDVHVAYHQPIVSYVKGWAKLKDDEDSMDGMRMFTAQWEKEMLQVFKSLNRNRTPKQWKVSRRG